MGGGEFVRAAAKIAGASAVNAGVRGASSAPHFGQLLRGASRPASVSVASSSPPPPAKATAGADVEAVQKPAWIDDWEFANWEDGLALESAGPEPRIVFGPVPSFEEAKEATTDLKEALDKVYLSSSPELSGSNLVASSDGKPEAESCLAIESSTRTPVPQHAIQAFRLLKESAEAQTLVASIASDPNVWNAMLANEELKKFLQSSYQTNKRLEYHKISEELEDAAERYAEEARNESIGVFHKTLTYIKTSIDDMLATASSFLQKLFGSSSAEVCGDDKSTSGFSTAEMAMGSIMGLVVLVAIVLFAKRN